MKKIKLPITIMLFTILMPINIVLADTYTLESNTSTNGKHYYIPQDIALPVSNVVNVVASEETTDNYLIDFDNKSWSLYSVTLEVFTDGTSEAFDDLKTKINNNSYDSLSYSTFTATSDKSYVIDGKTYTPDVDTLILAMGDEISIKSMGNQTYEEGESSGWTIFIQYSLNRYKSIDELNECVETTDDNEINMRRGLVQISIFYPSNESIDSYYRESSVNNYNDLKKDVTDSIIDNLGDDYTSEININGNTIIKDLDNNEILEVGKLEDNQIVIKVLDDSLDSEDVNELLIELATSIVGTDETLNINLNDDGHYVVTTVDGKEVFKISEEEKGKFTLNFTNSEYKVDSSNTQNYADSSISNDAELSSMPIVEVIALIFLIVLMIVIIVKTTFKKKR